MSEFPSSFDKEGLLACARGELFGEGNAQLPAPPMLMMDRFNLGWRGWQGRGYALGVGEVKLTGMVRPDRKMLTYKIDFTKAIQTRRLTMGVADGIVEADGEVIYQVKDMKVALSES